MVLGNFIHRGENLIIITTKICIFLTLYFLSSPDFVKKKIGLGGTECIPNLRAQNRIRGGESTLL